MNHAIAFLLLEPARRIVAWISAHPFKFALGVGSLFFINVSAVVIARLILPVLARVIGENGARWIGDHPWVLGVPLLLFPPTTVFGLFLIIGSFIPSRS